MCYLLYLSTSRGEDLTQYNSELLRFERLERTDDGRLDALRNSQKWFVGSKSGCSCTFRQFYSTESGFAEPQDWCPEDEDNVRATAELYRVILAIVVAGESVDCLDLHFDATADQIKELTVDLKTVGEKQFLFLENHHYTFTCEGSDGST